MYFVGALGIGGTHFHYAAGTSRGTLQTAVHTESTNATALDDQITRAIERLEAETPKPLAAIAVASKGLVDPAAGTIELMDIKGGDRVTDVSLTDVIATEFDVPVHLENDCAAAALAEYHFGVGSAHDSLVHITMGTGIGAGIIDRGRIVRGSSNYAGEVGGIQVGPPDGLEWSDIPGAWEAYCSGPGIAEFVRRRLRTETRDTQLRTIEDAADPTPRIFAIADDGDEVAQEYLDDIARMNANGLATVANLYDPGIITLGGGVASNNPEFIVEGAKRHIEDFIVDDPPEIRVTDIDNMGIAGALAQVAHAEADLQTVADSVAVEPDLGDD